MGLQKRKLAIVQWGSYRSFPVGGISTFVESIIPQLGDAFELKLIGMSLGEKIGRWTTINVAEKTYDFLPVVSATQSTFVPDRLRLAWAMAKYREAVCESGADAYYVHMTEAAIPLVLFGDDPVVIHVHGLYNLFRYSRHWLGKPFAAVYEMLYPQLFSRCAKVLGVGSETEFEKFRRVMRVGTGAALPTCVRENIFYRRDRTEGRRELGIGANETVLLYVGRLTETKNPRLLVEVGRLLCGDIPNLKLVFVGDGPLRAQIEADGGSSEKIIMTGALTPEKTATWMNAADALAVVSKTEAFTSIVALEALSCGLPVVATPVSALPEMIITGVNGTVSRDFTPESYASAVKTVLRARPDTRSCRESVAAYTSVAVGARVVKELHDLFPKETGHPQQSASPLNSPMTFACSRGGPSR